MNDINSNLNPDDNGHEIDKRRALTAVIVVSLMVLAGVLLAGRLLGETRAAILSRNTPTQVPVTQDKVSQPQSASANLQKDNDALRADLAAAQGQLSEMQSQYTDIQESSAEIQKDLKSAQGQLSQLQSQYGNMQGSNAALQEQLAAAQQTITSLQAQLKAAQQSIAELQTQLAAWYAWSHNAPTSPSLILSPASGPRGTGMTITGSSFTRATTVSVVFDTNRNGVADAGEQAQNTITSSTGTFSATLIVPLLPPGTYPILAIMPDGMAAQASAIFTVTNP